MITVDDSGLKHCSRDPSHIWLADLPFCPYCNCSGEIRIHGMQQTQEIERLEKRVRELEGNV